MSNVMTWPSRPPMHPPGCDCGCRDSSGLFECWDQMSQFQQMVTDIVTKILTNNPQPLTGVTDGSDAKAGQVGELISGSATLSFPATGATVGTINPLVVAPGDWDLWAWIESTVWVQLMQFTLVVASVPGISNPMGSQSLAPTVAVDEGMSRITGVQARGSFSVPTLLPFSVSVTGAGTAGVATLYVQGRRVR